MKVLPEFPLVPVAGWTPWQHFFCMQVPGLVPVGLSCNTDKTFVTAVLCLFTSTRLQIPAYDMTGRLPAGSSLGSCQRMSKHHPQALCF